MSASKAIVTLPENVKTIKDALQLAKLDIPIIVIKTNGIAIPEGTVCFNELSEDGHVDTSVLKQVRRTANDICILPYSSGTTGMPKGVELSNRNIIANCEQINEPLVACHNETTGKLINIFDCKTLPLKVTCSSGEPWTVSDYEYKTNPSLL